MWDEAKEDGSGGGMTLRDVSYVPGLYKIFDEILVNAADNKVREAEGEGGGNERRGGGTGFPKEKKKKNIHQRPPLFPSLF